MTDSALKDSNSSSSGLSLDECEEAGEEVSDTVLQATSQHSLVGTVTGATLFAFHFAVLL